MQSQKVIKVTLENIPSYIFFVSSIQELASIVLSSNFVVFDRTVQNNFSQLLSTYNSFLILNGGEIVKTQAGLQEIIDAFFQHNLLRTSSVTAVGGGALCDSVSFAASLYMRGIECTLIPTTLLAMVDASIGGKTAINAFHHKNIIGSFFPPKKVIICSEFLHTLPSRHYISGIAEIIKAGMLYDSKIISIFEKLLQSSIISDNPIEDKEKYENTNKKNIYTLLQKKSYNAVLLELIERAILVKKMVIETDFKEQNIRSFLNLGHTFAHAIESNARIKGLDILHGEAVGLGIRSALKLGEILSVTNSEYASRIYTLLDAIGFSDNYSLFNLDDILFAMQRDKKADMKGLRFILQKQQGETERVYVEKSAVKEVLISMGILH